MSSVDPVQLISKPDSCSQGKAFISLGVFFGFFNKPITLKRELCSKSSGTAVEGTSSYGNTNKVSTRQHKPSVKRERKLLRILNFLFKAVLCLGCLISVWNEGGSSGALLERFFLQKIGSVGRWCFGSILGCVAMQILFLGWLSCHLHPAFLVAAINTLYALLMELQ